MSVEECKARLPLPDLLKKMGYGELNRAGFMSSPFRPNESGDSFHVFARNGQHFFKDHASNEGGDEVNFLKFLLGMDDRAAIGKYHELAGVEWYKPRADGGKAEDADRAKPGKAGGDFIGKPVATYVYHTESGGEAFQVLKFLKDDGKKTFRQRRRAREGERSSNGWVWQVEQADRVLYRLPEILAQPTDQPIFLVEGEKCADAIRGLGLLGTTMPCGAKEKGVNWHPSYTASLAGKWVVLMGDNDKPGRAHVAAVAELIRPVVARLSIIDIAKEWGECPEKGDVADWVAVMTAERN